VLFDCTTTPQLNRGLTGGELVKLVVLDMRSSTGIDRTTIGQTMHLGRDLRDVWLDAF
jgi:hypothetical protein